MVVKSHARWQLEVVVGLLQTLPSFVKHSYDSGEVNIKSCIDRLNIVNDKIKKMEELMDG